MFISCFLIKSSNRSNGPSYIGIFILYGVAIFLFRGTDFSLCPLQPRLAWQSQPANPASFTLDQAQSSGRSTNPAITGFLSIYSFTFPNSVSFRIQ